jgi:hypothetical protein
VASHALKDRTTPVGKRAETMNSGILWMENQKPVILSPYDSVLPPARMSELLKKCHILRLFEIQPNRNVQEAEFKHLRGHGGEKTESGMTLGSRQHGRAAK